MKKSQPTTTSTNIVYAGLIGATVGVMVVVILTVWADLNRGVWEWLRDTLTHHWVGKGIIGAAAFIISGAFVAGGPPKSEASMLRAARTLYWTSAAGGIFLVAYFFYEVFIRAS